MFRRRPFRRRLLPRAHLFTPLAETPRRTLRHANNLMESGNFPAAAQLFEELSESALANGLRRHAPFLFLQTARAQLLAGEDEKGMANLKHGLTLLAEDGRWQARQRSGEIANHELQEMGKGQAASELIVWLKKTQERSNQGSKIEEVEKFTVKSKQPFLPTKCPFCGGVIRSDAVEWIDDISIECLYCGSTVRGEI